MAPLLSPADTVALFFSESSRELEVSISLFFCFLTKVKLEEGVVLARAQSMEPNV